MISVRLIASHCLFAQISETAGTESENCHSRGEGKNLDSQCEVCNDQSVHLSNLQLEQGASVAEEPSEIMVNNITQTSVCLVALELG